MFRTVNAALSKDKTVVSLSSAMEESNHGPESSFVFDMDVTRERLRIDLFCISGSSCLLLYC